MSLGCLVDLSKCVGCRTCQVICRHWHQQPTQSLPLFSYSRDDLDQPDLSEKDLTVVRSNVIKNEKDETTWVFAKRQCMHCLDPGCASACPVKALRKTPEGPVIYREDLCMGCRYCMIACPFNIPRFDYDKVVPSIRKCTFCSSRLLNNKPETNHDYVMREWGDGFAPDTQSTPCCASKCPARAILLGERDKLIEYAHTRIHSVGKTKYVNHIYGEHEAGGTSWMYISDVPFQKAGFDLSIDTIAYPEYTKPFLTGVPLVIILGSGLMTGLYWIIKRRDEMARENELSSTVATTEHSTVEPEEWS